MDVTQLALIALAALAGGAVNAIAGGGSLITFPVLLASGLPPVIASMTNTVAMCPGYLGATFAQRRELAGQGTRAWTLIPLSIAGSLAGAYILMQTTDRAFATIVPFLLLFAALLLALQGPLRKLLARPHATHSVGFAIVPIAAAAIYGAYFGAGMGVMILAVLAVVVDDTLARANALKQLLALVINVCAAVVFLVFARIDGLAAVAIATGALVGGALGGMLASRVPEALLRWLAISIAIVVAGIYFARL